MNRKEFAPTVILLILLGILIAGGGIWYWKNQSPEINIQTSTSAPITQNKSLANILGWTLNIPSSSTALGTLKKHPSTFILFDLGTSQTEQIRYLLTGDLLNTQSKVVTTLPAQAEIRLIELALGLSEGYPVENGFVSQGDDFKIYYLNTQKKIITLLPAEMGYGVIEFVDKYNKSIFYYSSTAFSSDASFPKLYRFNFKTNKSELLENEAICCSINTEYKGQVGDKIVLRWGFFGGRRGYSSDYGNIDTKNHTLNRIVELGYTNSMCPDDNYDNEGNCNVSEIPGSSDFDNLIWFGDGNSMLGLKTVSSTSATTSQVSLSTINLLDGATHIFYTTTFSSNKDTEADVLRGYDDESLLFSDVAGKLKIFNTRTQKISDAPSNTPRDVSSTDNKTNDHGEILDLLDFQQYKLFIEIPGKGKVFLDSSDNSIRFQPLIGSPRILIQNASSAQAMFATGNYFIYDKLY